MSTKKFKVLSIDFDYFVKMSADQMVLFPDPIDLPTELSTFVWASTYAYNKNKIEKIAINKSAISKMRQIIKSNRNVWDDDCTTMITNSHKHIYDFITKKYKPKRDGQLIIYNIDMHHDMYPISSNVDCGNWATHIKKKYKNSEITWIQNRISNELFPPNYEKPDHITKNFDCIQNEQFDLIFLCRSDNWLPPHLDCEFQKLKDTITENFLRSYIDSQILEPRDVKPIAEQLRSEHNKFLETQKMMQKEKDI